MMKKLYPLLVSLVLGSSVFAMNTPEVASVVAKAFGELPQSSLVTEADRTAFQNKCQNYLPKVLAHEIGEHAGKSNAAFIAQHIKELIPCVVKNMKPDTHWYKPVQKMMKNAEGKLTNAYQTDYLPHMATMPAKNLSDKPYVLGVVGLWSFVDEDSKLRSRFMRRDFANDDRDIFVADRDRLHDVSEWFENEYAHPVKVKPMSDNEFLGILYSDGTIGWKISPLNMARLKGKLFSQQLTLGKELFSQSRILDEKQLQVFKTIPARYREIMKSNFGRMFPQIMGLNHENLSQVKKEIEQILFPAILIGLVYYGSGGNDLAWRIICDETVSGLLYNSLQLRPRKHFLYWSR